MPIPDEFSGRETLGIILYQGNYTIKQDLQGREICQIRRASVCEYYLGIERRGSNAGKSASQGDLTWNLRLEERGDIVVWYFLA